MSKPVICNCCDSRNLRTARAGLFVGGIPNRGRAASWRFFGVLLAAFLAPITSQAAGTTASVRGPDLQMTVDSRWAGCSEGGYYPIRIRVTNLAAARTLLFMFVDTGGGESRLPTVERQVQIGQNATQQFTLSVPMVSYASYGELRVIEEGRQLDGLTQRLPLADANASAGAVVLPSLLVIHPTPASIDYSRFEEATQLLAAGTRTSRRRFASGYSVPGRNDSQAIDPAMLPDSWIDYTGLDLVAIPLATVERLPAAMRTALVHWAEAGGTLLIYNVGEPAAQSKNLASVLQLDERTAAPNRWHDAITADHQPIPEPFAGAQFGGRGAAAPGLPPGWTGAAPDADESTVESTVNASVWAIRPETFSRLDLLAGRVYAFPANPFPGAPIDWAWWLNSAEWRKSLSWTARLGGSSRRQHPQFFDYLIPGVGAVPIVAFVGLISLFAVSIGPVNYFILWKRKQLYLLVVTIPAIALLTSAALFAYAVVADGFSVRSRVRSVTVLDQERKRAVSFSRISLYAGLATSAGLRFSPATAVFPLWPDDAGLESGTVDWTESQDLKTGWLRSRTPAQFQTIAHRDERGRLEVRNSESRNNVLEVSNGLEWPLAAVVVRDDKSRLFIGNDLAAGASQSLRRAEEGDLAVLAQALAEDKPAAPPGLVGGNTPFARRNLRSMMRYGGNPGGPPLAFTDSLLETGLRRLNRAAEEPGEGGLPVRSYLAIVREPPSIEVGVPQTRSSHGVHALIGLY